MNNVTSIYLNGLAIAILMLTMRNYRSRFKYIKKEEKFFLLLVISTIFILLLGFLLKNLWSIEGRVMHITLYVLQNIDFALSVIIPFLWLYYCIFRLYFEPKHEKLLKYIIPLPMVLFILLMLFSSGSGLVFLVTSANKYLRGPLFILSIICGYIYLVAALLLIVVKRKILSKGELFPYLMMPILPTVIGILEVVFTISVSLTWSVTALVLLEIQMHVLNNKTSMDHLTRLNNRMALDNYLKTLIRENHQINNTIGLIMIDLDGFKLVNDEYGHAEGDIALKTASDILRATLESKYFIARYGGDEFTIVIKDCTPQTMENITKKLEIERQKANKSMNKPYDIRFSLGVSIFDHQDIVDIHTMLKRVDKLMYENKQLKKAST